MSRFLGEKKGDAGCQKQILHAAVKAPLQGPWGSNFNRKLCETGQTASVKHTAAVAKG
jgi:hypothetical protein